MKATCRRLVVISFNSESLQHLQDVHFYLSYRSGNDYKVQVSQFAALYKLGQQNGNSVDLDVLTNYRVTRFQESISENPYFFNAPFSGVVASPAAWSFIYRFMANKSSEHPKGLLTGDVLKSFYSITGEYPNFAYTPGHEAFPGKSTLKPLNPFSETLA